MPARFARPSRWAPFFVSLVAVLAIALFGGCGRSDIEETFFADAGRDGGSDAGRDARADGGTCGPATCPNGCCDAKGVCRSGVDLQACGTFGVLCADCPSAGFDFCDVTSHACGRTVLACDGNSCADGCCEGGLCLSGGDANECGAGGRTCQHCAARGQACDSTSRACAGPACGSSTCAGCCVADLCVVGTAPTACGRTGEQCENCKAQGRTCLAVAPGGACAGEPACSSQNCAGCCLGNACVMGADDQACGVAGQQCRNCASWGEVCLPVTGGGSCEVPTCGPQNCEGCCQGNTCVQPPSENQCGAGGSVCERCGSGQTCTDGLCIGTGLCNVQSCPNGCCVGDICAQGTQNTACGTGGAACSNCQASNAVCKSGKCVQTCGPANCDGCCSGDTCVKGTDANTCGAGGGACSNCTSLGEVCQAGVCRSPPPPCTPSSCAAGCCDPVRGCVAGFLNTTCGSGGTACVDCNALGSTCDVGLVPRVCKSQQSTCPAPYPSCSSAVTTPAPAIQHVCSASDLQNAAAACAAGANSTGCQQFMQYEQQQNSGCASCLRPFSVPFDVGTGVFACVAPFVSPSCDHTTGCFADCLSRSCAACASGSVSQCQSSVLSGACAPYLSGVQCITRALYGTAPFCNPGSYQGDFGQWLQGVGGHYCGP
jgi:hypothetical protein